MLLPLTMPSDQEAIAAAFYTCGAARLGEARVAAIHDTLHLEELLISSNLLEENDLAGRLTVLSPPRPWRFTSAGDLEWE